MVTDALPQQSFRSPTKRPSKPKKVSVACLLYTRICNQNFAIENSNNLFVLGKAKIADSPYRQLPGARELINSYLYLDLEKWQISRKRGESTEKCTGERTKRRSSLYSFHQETSQAG
jgi:hypothetical protein